jgi:tripartite-type tricarboxylate transporter receptor subunit TctC
MGLMMTVHAGRRQGRRGKLLALACTLSFALSLNLASAETWPARTVIVIVPFGAGSASDLVPRIVLNEVSRKVGQPIVVENRPGAGGTLGANAVAKAAADGYTLLASGALPATHALYPTLPYATLRDFAPVSPLGQQPLVLVTAPSKGYRTLGDLVAAAKASPGKLNFASAGLGTPTHLAAERLRLSASFEAQHIPFKGSPEALTELLAGRVDFYLSPIGPVLSLIGDGKLIALAVSAAKRATALPQVPTMAEAGLTDAAYEFWVGLYLPAKTPRNVIVEVHKAVDDALQVVSVREGLARLGVEPMPMSLDEFGAYFRNDVAANMGIVNAAHISVRQ